MILALAAAALIVLFGGDSHLLIPLFAIGAFLAFTLVAVGHGLSLVPGTGPGLATEGVLQRRGSAGHRHHAAGRGGQQIRERRLDHRARDPA